MSVEIYFIDGFCASDVQGKTEPAQMTGAVLLYHL